ncbi:MAG: methyltransferase domain-containing protein [Gemmatimonadetes bacterium]|nr:methyltransferase domain-containing protein [Gemmatimonadota bacterium]
MTAHSCAFCGAALVDVFADLGASPLANSYLGAEDLDRDEPVYPLVVFVCAECLLVQIPAVAAPEHIFSDYAYFSSYSDSWLRHAASYVDIVTERFRLGPSSLVVEVASNDGYLLQFFQRRGIPVLGIEPAANVAAAAREKGIPTRVEFFGTTSARALVAEGTRADLMVGNNVLAHVPSINDFVEGFRILLAPRGVLTMEFPHLMRLMEGNQFDTIYHEHFFYFSFLAVERVFARHCLTIFDVEELPTHGGSLRIYVRHQQSDHEPVTARVDALRRRELDAGFGEIETYRRFNHGIHRAKERLLGFLDAARREGRSVAAYGAPAKGNTLLNFCGVGPDRIAFTVDRSPHKQGRYLPGSHIPIFAPERLAEERPDYVLILPWNLKDEIIERNAFIREWGGRFVIPIPEVQVL